MHGEGDAVHLAASAARVVQAQAGQEADAAPAGGAQLFAGALEGAGLADQLLVQYRHLIGADDQVLRVAAGQGLRLLLRQAAGQGGATFVGSG